jgi:hypothetical protein
MTRGWFDWQEGSAGWPGAVVAIAFTILGATMVFEPTRYNHSTAYGIATEILDIRWWGVVYLVAALLKAAYLLMFRLRHVAIAVHVTALSVTVWWLAILLIRYRLDGDTTVVPSLLWAILLALILRSMKLMPPPPGRRHDATGGVRS